MDIKLISNDLKFKYRVSGIIVNNGRVLVNKYGENKFCLPGGYVEVGESSLEAIRREILEEVQIHLNDIDYMGIIENFFTNYKGVNTHGLDFYYRANVSDEDIKKIDMNYVENDKDGMVQHHFSWLSIRNLNEYDIVPNKLIKIIQNNEENFHYIINEKRTS